MEQPLDITELMEISGKPLLERIRTGFWFFNKPKGSIYRAVLFVAKTNLLDELGLFKTEYESIRKTLHQNDAPKVLIINEGRGISVVNFHMFAEAISNQTYAASKEAYIIYAEPNENMDFFYEAGTQIKESRELFEGKLHTMWDSVQKTSKLLSRFYIGETVENFQIGNCGDCCDYFSSVLIKEHYKNTRKLFSIQTIQADFISQGESLFSHCFSVFNAKKEFNINLEGLENAYFVDPWNYTGVKATELMSNNSNEASYLKFVIKNSRLFKFQVVFSTHPPEKIPIDTLMAHKIEPEKKMKPGEYIKLSDTLAELKSLLTPRNYAKVV